MVAPGALIQILAINAMILVFDAVQILQIGVGVFKEGVFLAIQVKIGIDEKRRHPVGAVFVMLVGEVDELFCLFFVVGVDFCDGQHGSLCQGSSFQEIFLVITPFQV
jgi:hypothetical protein